MINRIIFYLTALFLSALVFAAPSASNDLPKLKQEIKVFSKLVTLGDLFENAGSAKKIAVFRAPNLGQTGTVSSNRVAKAAEKHGVIWNNKDNIPRVVVLRPSRRVGKEEIVSALRPHLADKIGLNNPRDLDVNLNLRNKYFHFNPKNDSPLIVKHLSFNEASGQFLATIALEEAGQDNKEQSIRGRAIETVQIVVMKKNIKRGELVKEDALEVKRHPKSLVREGLIQSKNQITGLEAKRRQLAKRPLYASDFEEPKMVKKNGLVEIIFNIPGISLKSEGRALSDAAEGETISVLNTQSKRTIQATVIGLNLVSVSRNKSKLVRIGAPPQKRTTPKRTYRVR